MVLKTYNILLHNWVSVSTVSSRSTSRYGFQWPKPESGPEWSSISLVKPNYTVNDVSYLMAKLGFWRWLGSKPWWLGWAQPSPTLVTPLVMSVTDTHRGKKYHHLFLGKEKGLRVSLWENLISTLVGYLRLRWFFLHIIDSSEFSIPWNF